MFADEPETCMQDGPWNMLAAPNDRSTQDSALRAQCPAAAAGEFFSTVSGAGCEQKKDTLQSAIPCADPPKKNMQQPAMPQSLHGLSASTFPAPDQQSCSILKSAAAADFAFWQTERVRESYSGSIPVFHSQQSSNFLNTRQSSSRRTPAEDSFAKAFSLSDWDPLLPQLQEHSIPHSSWHTDAASPTYQSSLTSGKTSLAIADTLLNDLFPQPRATLHTPDMQPALNQPGSLASRNASTQQSTSLTFAPLFAGEPVPRDADAKLDQLLAIFCDLLRELSPTPERVIANALQQAAYDVGAASYQLQVLLGWESPARDDGGPSAAAAAESLPLEPEPPVQAQGFLMGESQSEQVSCLSHNSHLHTFNLLPCHDIAAGKLAAVSDPFDSVCWH